MNLGLTLSPSKVFPTGRVMKLAEAADGLGFSSVWFAESDQADAIGLMHAAAVTTKSASIASGVIPIQTRPPALVAMGCANLAQLAPGRIRLGIGHSSPNVVGRWCDRPFIQENAVAQVREFVEAVSACLSGERVDFSGDWYQIKGFRLRVNGADDVDFVVAALGDGMAKAATEFADGILMSYITPSRLAGLVPQLKELSGRSFGVSVMLHVAITDSPAKSIDAYKRVLVSYSTVDAYAAVFGEAGFESQVEAVRRLWGEGDRSGALDAIDEEMVGELTAIGSADHVKSRITSLVEAGADEVVIGIVEGEGTQSAEETIAALAPSP
ncbi:MAG: hypothetical protein DCC49_08630 [Acidobacteria bacterium]|nr:MAG: hypothetical protein DCC49_08630 [Acidobacteriota bacterium]